MRYTMGKNAIPRDTQNGHAIVLNQRGEPAVMAGRNTSAGVIHSRSRFAELPEEVLYLGLWQALPLHVWVLRDSDSLPENMEFAPLRSMLAELLVDEAAAVCQAKQLVHWDTTCRYCGMCGALMRHSEGERARQCPECAHIVYPRISPAVIVAVTRGRELLLVQNLRHRGGMYSVVAGYVEPGETLEGTVAREVLEETGIKVSNIRYFGSQCWPFPSTMMIGFTADYASGDIIPQDDEIAEAGWFTPEAFPEIPGPGSISRELIDAFIQSTTTR